MTRYQATKIRCCSTTDSKTCRKYDANAFASELLDSGMVKLADGCESVDGLMTSTEKKVHFSFWRDFFTLLFSVLSVNKLYPIFVQN